MTKEEYEIKKAMQAIDNSGGVGEGYYHEMKMKEEAIRRTWKREREEETGSYDGEYDRYTSTGEDYEIDSDGLEYVPAWLQ